MATPTSAIALSALTYQVAKSRPGAAQPTQNIFVNVGRDPFKFSLTDVAVDYPTEEVVKALPRVQSVDAPLAPGQKHAMVISVPDGRVVEFFDRLDSTNKTTLNANAKTFFKKPPPCDVEELYMPILRPANERYSASMRVKIVTDHSDAAKNTKFYIADGFASRDKPLAYKTCTLSDVTPGSNVLVIVQCAVVWTQDRKCGMTFNATEMFVWQHGAELSGMAAFSFDQAKLSFIEVDA